MSWADENSISCWDYEDLEIGSDEKQIWETKEGKEIKYKDLTTNHIQNIIRFFKYTEQDKPNLFSELEKRLSKLKEQQ